jgi:hypothetical protein
MMPGPAPSRIRTAIRRDVSACPTSRKAAPEVIERHLATASDDPIPVF